MLETYRVHYRTVREISSVDLGTGKFMGDILGSKSVVVPAGTLCILIGPRGLGRYEAGGFFNGRHYGFIVREDDVELVS